MKLENGTITADTQCWILTMYYPIDKEGKSKKQLARIKHDFIEHQTYYGTLEQAVSAYCNLSLVPVQDDVKMLLNKLESLTNEIKNLNLTQYSRYVQNS